MRHMDSVLGTTLLGAVGLAEAFLDQIAQNATDNPLMSTSEVLNAVREGVRDFEPLLAEHLADSVLAGWITGYDAVAAQFPPWLQQEFRDTIRRRPPNDPPIFRFLNMFDDEPRLRLVNVENAATRLMEKGILTRTQFDAASDSAKRQAFTIAGQLGSESIDRIRFKLYEELSQGPSLASFTERVEDALGSIPIGAAHLENVYRTNLQAAYRDGRETLRSDPIVSATFPYQAYFAVHDARARKDHRLLETLGLNGTNVYRVDDPVWDYVTPPIHYNCRCSALLYTLEKAASVGVREAQEWLRTGRAPINPEYRLAAVSEKVKFQPGFGHRGNAGVILLSSVPTEFETCC
jgi:SPP1 gp7 family putative phage head morphogenesis protein